MTNLPASMHSAPSLPRLVPPWNGISFPRLAETIARARPDQTAFVDAPDTMSWLHRPARTLTTAAFSEAVRRFARQLATLGLKRGDTALLILPNSSDFSVAYIGALAAGIVPVPLSLALGVDQLRDAADITNAQAIVTVTRLGELEPALMMRDVAAQVFSVRTLASFGADCPDGVVSLDDWAEDDLDPFDSGRALAADDVSLVTMEFHGRPEGRPRALARTQSQLIAETIALTSTANVGPRGVILNTLLPGSAFGVIAGTILPLLVRAEVHSHGVFSSKTLERQLKATPGMIVIAPAALEPGLVELAAELEKPLGSVILLQRLDLGALTHPPSPALSGRVVDVTAMGEAGHYMLPRIAPGRRASLPQNWRQPGTRVVENDTLLLQARIDDAGKVSMRGFGVPNRLEDAAGRAIDEGIETQLLARTAEGQTFEPLFNGDPEPLGTERNAA